MSRMGIASARAPFLAMSKPDTTERYVETSGINLPDYNATGWTITMFVTMRAVPVVGGDRFLHQIGPIAGGLIQYHLPDGGWATFARRGAASVGVSQALAPVVGTRYRLCGWASNTTQGTQVDGLVTEAAQGVALDNGAVGRPLRLCGHSVTAGLGVVADLSDVRIYDRILTTNERNNIHLGNGFDDVRDGLVSWLRGNDAKVTFNKLSFNQTIKTPLCIPDGTTALMISPRLKADIKIKGSGKMRVI